MARASAWPKLVVICGLLLCSGCNKQRPERLPGETDIEVSSVELVAPGDEELKLAHGELFMLLGLRPESLLVTGRRFNEFRLAEDGRRIVSFWQTFGFFDVKVDEPDLEFSPDKKSVAVRWTVREGAQYHMGTLEIRRAPREYARALKELVPFERGDRVDLEEYRHARHAMAEHLQRQGYGHAAVYSRAFVDRAAKLVHWVYYVDEGPLTRIGSISVEGARNIPSELVLERMNLRSGEAYSLALKEKAELDLLDSGAYASAVVKPDAQVERVLPGDRPETGGDLSPEQVDGNGDLVPRKLPETVNLRVVVVEAPSLQLRVRAGAEADPTRGDLYAGARLFLRNLFGAQHHLVLDGTAGYGVLWSGDEDEPSGPYGDALIRYLRPGLFGRLGDFRLSAHYRDSLYPGFSLQEVTAGPGVRSSLARGLYLDVDTLFRFETQRKFGPFDDATRDALDLPDEDTLGGELDLGLTWDARNDGVEPTSGHLLAAHANWAPGEPLNNQRYVLVEPDARLFLPLDSSWSVALRSAGGWVFGESDAGVPISVRQFGGGAYGMRGFGRQRLSPLALCAPGAACEDEYVGGLSRLEGSLEVRFLPFRKPIGLAVFSDVGGTSTRRNPFASGVSLAFGFGPRVRLWYLPLSLDLAYRLLRESKLEQPDSFDPYLVFLRIGEAF